VVAANYKWYSRVKVVKTVVEALERAGVKRAD
jgi:polyphosphate kinase 2 (PPK2 family)